MTPLEETTVRLARVGVVLRKGAGEYHLSFRDHRGKVVEIVDSLDAALTRGLELADSAPAMPPPLGPTGSSGSAWRGMIYRHNRKLAAKRRRTAQKSDQ